MHRSHTSVGSVGNGCWVIDIGTEERDETTWELRFMDGKSLEVAILEFIAREFDLSPKSRRTTN